MKRYLAPSSTLREWLERQPRLTSGSFDLRYEDVLDLIRRFLAPVPVDVAWYFSAYPGIAAAVDAGDFASASDHFIRHGYFELNRPFEAEQDDLRYPRDFQLVKAKLPVHLTRTGLRVSLALEEIFELARGMLVAVPVEEDWYCDLYPAIAQAMREGEISSARNHFAEHGYFEDRIPFRMDVDEDWYLNAYPDVAALIAAGDVASAEDHFLTAGYSQGRLPRQL